MLRERQGRRRAHNSHIGDARATSMGRIRGELNLGQLCREALGDQARPIGFSTHDGTVAAATSGAARWKSKRVNPSRPDSYERLFHETEIERFFLDLRANVRPDLRSPLTDERLQRFIGVIYRPETERSSPYSGAVLSEQYGGWVWLDHTEAVAAFADAPGRSEVDTFPFGL